jgi:hypothetical protein
MTTTPEQATQRWTKERDEWGDVYTSRSGDYRLKVWPPGGGVMYYAEVDTGLMLARTSFPALTAAQAWCVETADRMREETAI